MPAQTFDTTVSTLNAVLTRASDRKLVDHAIQAANGDWIAANGFDSRGGPPKAYLLMRLR